MLAAALLCASVGVRAAPTAAPAVAPAVASTDAAADASTELNPAQTLIYDTPHLGNTRAGETLTYDWSARDGVSGTPATGDVGEAIDVHDRATLAVTAAHDDGARDVTLDFLTDERRLELPPFEGWHGNPVLLATFERFAQDFAATGGGGTLYFRNRIRDALADDARLSTEDVEADWKGTTVAATRIELSPFANDPYVGARAGFGDATISLVLSPDVPGGVLSAAVDAPGEAGYRHELRLGGDIR